MIEQGTSLYFLDEQFICKKLSEQRKLGLIRKESKQGLGTSEDLKKAWAWVVD